MSDSYRGHDQQDTCPERPDDGGDTWHCFHEITGAVSCVCCWCGDLFEDLDLDEPHDHGPYSGDTDTDEEGA